MSHNTKKKNELLLLIIVQYVGKNIMEFRPKIDDLLGVGNAVSNSGFLCAPAEAWRRRESVQCGRVFSHKDYRGVCKTSRAAIVFLDRIYKIYRIS